MCIASPVRYKRSAFMLAVYAFFLCSSAQSKEPEREIRFDTLAYPGAANTLAFDTFSMPDTCFTRPTAINNLGQIVGSYFRSDEEGNSITTGFIYWKGRFTELHIPGSNETEITGINDRGNVVGWYVTDAGQFGFETNVYQFLRQRR